MVLTSTHNLCFEQKYEKYQFFVSENFQFLEVKFSMSFIKCIFVMPSADQSDLNLCISHILVDIISFDADYLKSLPHLELYSGASIG